MRQRKRTAIGIAVAMLALYLLLFPRGTGEGLQITVRWAAPINAADAATQDAEVVGRGTPLAFRLADRFGYLSREEGELLLLQEAVYDVALDDGRFSNYSKVSQTVVVQDPRGVIVGSIDTEGYPLFFGNRTLVLHPDGSTISEWRSDGALMWRYSMPAVYSAIDAAADVTLVGAIDGRMVAVDRSGRELLRYRSRSGRLPVVAAVALSSDAESAAAMLDIDPQRIVLFRRDGDGYAATAELELAQSLRRPPQLRFVSADRLLIWEQPDSLGVVGIDTQTRYTMPLAGRLAHLADIPALDLLAVVTTDSNELMLLQLPHGSAVIRLPLAEGALFLRADDQTVLLGVDDVVVSYRLESG
ncbi:MAG: hypothetical protein EA384_05350 [Spirochaetaceae bacterium]|nr:MAG: hypothetical protein EA384_05350 [Spirochaetaceae bacterium]